MTAPTTRRLPRATATARLRRGTATAAAAAALVVGVAACGSSTSAGGAGTTSKLAPLDAVKTGVRTLENGNAVTATIKLDVTAAQLAAISKADGDAADDSGDALAEKLIPGGSIVIEETAAGKTFAADQNNLAAALGGSFSIAVNAGDAPDLVQLAYLNKQVYARADVHTLAGYDGPSGPSQVQSFAAAEGPKFPFITSAVAGGWLHVDGGALYQFVKTADPTAIPSVSPNTDSTLLSGLEAELAKDVTATRAAADPTLGDHLVLTGNVQTVGADLVKALSSAEASVPGASKLLGSATDTSSLPDKDVSVNAYVKGGALDAVTFDLAQVLDPADKAALAGQPLYLEVDIARTAAVSAPASSTTISVSQIVQLFEGLDAGDTASGSAPTSASA